MPYNKGEKWGASSPDRKPNLRTPLENDVYWAGQLMREASCYYRASKGTPEHHSAYKKFQEARANYTKLKEELANVNNTL